MFSFSKVSFTTHVNVPANVNFQLVLHLLNTKFISNGFSSNGNKLKNSKKIFEYRFAKQTFKVTIKIYIHKLFIALTVTWLEKLNISNNNFSSKAKFSRNQSNIIRKTTTTTFYYTL